MQWTRTIWTTLKEDQPRIIPVKFGQNPISGLGGDVIWRNCLRTDGWRMHEHQFLTPQWQNKQTPIQTLTSECTWRMYGRTNRWRTTDKMWSQKLTLSLHDRWAKKTKEKVNKHKNICYFLYLNEFANFRISVKVYKPKTEAYGPQCSPEWTAVKANILNYSAKFQLYPHIFSQFLVAKAINQCQPLRQNSYVW